jgi:hypothetical protein
MAIILASLVACTEYTTASKPFQVALDATPQVAAPGDSISFVVSASGGSLVGVEIDFNDGTTDLYPTSGAQTARVTFRHAYNERGSFVVRAVVTDALAGQKEATVEVLVN